MNPAPHKPLSPPTQDQPVGWIQSTVMLFIIVMAVKPAVANQVDFSHEVVPILRQHCVPCHGGLNAKGSFSLNTRSLLIDSGYLVPEDPADSHIMELVQSADPDVQMPPPEQPRVSAGEIAILKRWITEGAAWETGFSFSNATYEPPLLPRRPDLPAANGGSDHPIDRIVVAHLKSNQQSPLAPIDDQTFMRRVSLDLVGLLPDPDQLLEFVADGTSDKREHLIDRLLDDDIAYADHWLSFYNDLFRNDYSGTGFITGGRSQISGWLYDSLRFDKRFDVMARELIAPPSDASRGYIDGIKWRGEVSAGQTNEIQFAQSVAQSFLGINLKCASCHDSFIDRWTLDDAYGLAAIYSERPLEIHRCDKPVGRVAKPAWLFPEIGEIDTTAPRDEKLRQLADLMTHPDNGRFSRTIANRLWYKMLGRGIVHPLDAMQSAPWNADLLDYLASDFTDSGYNLKALLKRIAMSKTYQSQAVDPANEEDGGGGFLFSGPLARRMTAELFLDNVWKLTQSNPPTMDAPVNRYPEQVVPVQPIAMTAKWIWGNSAADAKIPPADEQLTFRKTILVPKPPSAAALIITCDNQFIAYVNGHEVGRGDDWSQPTPIRLKKYLKVGENSIVVVASNGGNAPNPAGLFVEGRLIFDEMGDAPDATATAPSESETVIITSDPSWDVVSGNVVPGNRADRLADREPLVWTAATVVPTLSVWNDVIEKSGPSMLQSSLGPGEPPIRASLMKNSFLMKSLGRPLREQIVSMRPSELTTLEAIDLSNGQEFANSLAKGAQSLAGETWSSPDQLIERLFLSSLCRLPTADESRVVRSFLGSEPTAAEIEDLLWSLLMMPEFMLIR